MSIHIFWLLFGKFSCIYINECKWIDNKSEMILDAVRKSIFKKKV